MSCCLSKTPASAPLGILEPNAAQVLGIMLAAVKSVQHDALIADHADASVCADRVDTTGIQAALGTGDKKYPGLMHLVKPKKSR